MNTFKLTPSTPERLILIIDTSLDTTESGIVLGEGRQCLASVWGTHPEDTVFSADDTVLVNRDDGILLDEPRMQENYEIRLFTLRDVLCKIESVEPDAQE